MERLNALFVWLRAFAASIPPAFGSALAWLRAFAASIPPAFDAFSIWLRRRAPRMSVPAILATVLMLAVAAMAPQQGPVVLYKLGAVACGLVLGYVADLALFPYAQPSGYLRFDWREVQSFEDDKPDYAIVDGYETPFLVATCRRAAIACVCMLAVGLAL